ncbi:Os03g0195100 [Oryza sativa Japonica Group]|uniref:Os03g0195100 protein n=1 Tax=Oryza sativa subsp. japonica TaxID=39947 RepID=A0A0P0VU73_ORYSJ|nr:Os03g0195100 [Oryza sativa Japonica Group]
MPVNMISKLLEKAVLPALDVAPPVKIGGPRRTSVLRNPNMEKLQKGYLFPEISIKREEHLKKYPDAKVISLGIGDTTEPIPSIVTSAMAEYALALSTPEGYQGYGPEQGHKVIQNTENPQL